MNQRDDPIRRILVIVLMILAVLLIIGAGNARGDGLTIADIVAQAVVNVYAALMMVLP